MRLDQFLQSSTGPGLSRRAIQAKIRSGDVTVGGRPFPVRASIRVKEGQTVAFTIRRTTHEDEYWNGQIVPLEKAKILYQDDGLVALYKPPFMSTHPTGRHLFHCATVFLEQKTGRPVHSLHRLDRETSGVLLLAKNPRAARFVTPFFELGKVKKSYFFIAEKRPHFKGACKFSANERLGSEKKTLRERVCVFAYPTNSPRGRHARTDFKILWETKDRRGIHYLLGLAFPRTGRQHQIRVHAKTHGFPLLGDKLYCGDYPLFQRFKDLCATPLDHQLMQIPRHALHALAIQVPHTNQPFWCPLPDDLVKWMAENLDLPFPLESIEEQLRTEVFREFFA